MTVEWLDKTQIAGLPEGYTARPATMDDLEAAVAVMNACSLAMIGREEHKLDVIRREWQTPGWVIETDTMLVLAPDGVIVGYEEVWNGMNPKVRPFIWGRVHPDHANQGIGTYLIQWAEARLRSDIDQAPAGAQVLMQTGFDRRDKAAHALVTALGFEPIRYFWRMEVEHDGPPAEAQWPDGITVRTIQPGEDERKAYRVARTAFRDHWGHLDMPFEEVYALWESRFINVDDYDRTLRFLALDGGQIIGTSFCIPKPFDGTDAGWITTLGVLREYRGRGIAKALLLHSFGEFYRRGQKRVGLGVDAENPTGATKLYERVGMRVTREFANYGKELRPGADLTQHAADH
jgi:mycothiol synthase